MSDKSMVEYLAEAERTIGKVAAEHGHEWEWAAWSKPTTGGPFMWNDIIVRDSVNSYAITAADYIEWSE